MDLVVNNQLYILISEDASKVASKISDSYSVKNNQEKQHPGKIEGMKFKKRKFFRVGQDLQALE